MRARVAAVGFSLVLAGCSSGPTSPATGATPSAPLAGDWAIDYVVESCTGNRQCGHSLGKTQRVYLRLLDEGDSVSGAYFAHPRFAAIALSGTKAGRQIDVAGIAPAAFPAAPGSYTLGIKLKGRLQAAASGDIEYTATGVPQGDFFGNYVVKGKLVSAERVNDLPSSSSFSGIWPGNMATGSCSGGAPGQSMTIYEMTLTQTGDRVEGTMRLGGSMVIPVAGTAAGDQLRLEGVLETVAPFSRSINTVIGFAGRRDRVGFIRGSFRHRAQYLPVDGRANDTACDIELWGVLLRP